jgi:hypothetical protein
MSPRIVTVELFGGPQDGTKVDLIEEMAPEVVELIAQGSGCEYRYGRLSRTRFEYLGKV